MKRRSNAVVTAIVVTMLALSAIGAGTAAVGAGSAPGTNADAAASQTQSVAQSADATTSTATVTDEDADGGATADGVLESADVDRRFGPAGADDVATFLEGLFDDLGLGDSSDGVGSDDGSGTDGDGSTDSAGGSDGTGEVANGDSNGTAADAGSDGAAGGETADTGLDGAQVERYVHEAVNDERTARGLEPLAFDAELRDVARNHSEDMAERGYFAHVDPEGNDFADRYEAAGYECRVNGYAGGENLAQTWYDTPVRTPDGDVVRYETERELAEGIVAQWMNSPGHRRNLLAPQWENEGIGVAVTDDNEVYVTQNFC